MSKLHLATRLLYDQQDGVFTLFTKCGCSRSSENDLTAFHNTNSIDAMVLLPRAKVCQNCMKAYRAQHTPAGRRGMEE